MLGDIALPVLAERERILGRRHRADIVGLGHGGERYGLGGRRRAWLGATASDLGVHQSLAAARRPVLRHLRRIADALGRGAWAFGDGSRHRSQGRRSRKAYARAASAMLGLNATRDKYDLIHAHTGHCGMLALAGALPVLVSYVGYDLYGKPIGTGEKITTKSRVEARGFAAWRRS